jgi:hypothetical protein
LTADIATARRTTSRGRVGIKTVRVKKRIFVVECYNSNASVVLAIISSNTNAVKERFCQILDPVAAIILARNIKVLASSGQTFTLVIGQTKTVKRQGCTVAV